MATIYTPPPGHAVNFDFGGGASNPPLGHAVNFDFSQLLNPAGGQIVFSGAKPFVVPAMPAAGHIIFLGAIPTLKLTLLPGAGPVTFHGSIPTIKEVLKPSGGLLVFTGATPTLVLPAGITDDGNIIIIW